MKKIFSDLPSKDDLQIFLTILGRVSRIEKGMLDTMFKFFKEDFIFIFNVFEGKKISFPKIEDLDKICLMIKIYKEIKKMLDYGMKFENVINILAEKHKITSNQIFQYYNDINKILLERS